MAKMGRALALLLAVATTVSAKTCPSGWREFKDNCYFFGSVKTWSSALSDCQQIGAGMAVVTDSATNDFLANLPTAEGHGNDNYLWLGLNDRVTEGDFRWTDGSKATYTNWYLPHEPNDGVGSGEDCTEMYLDSKVWNDIGCDTSKHYVCQLEYAVDECADGTDNCDPNAACTDAPSGFSCACNAGFTGDGTTCTDVDECADGSNNCDSNAACTNTPGGFTCACNTGYIGDGVTCSPGTFLCSDGQTIPYKRTCDRIVDCSDAGDELIRCDAI